MRRLLGSLLFISVIVAGFVGISGNANAAAASSGCDDYAIMRCGAGNHREFINKTNVNAPGDLKGLYANFGLSQSDYSKFVGDAKRGTIYDDGRIVVDGRTVGRSNLNIARVRDNNFNHAVNVNGNTYYGGPFGSTYHANQADVMVLMKDGQLKFAAISSCGNPQRFTPTQPPAPEPEPKPEYQCKAINKTAVKGEKNTYRFTTNTAATQGAEVVSVTYDFGDGKRQTVTNPNQAVEHTFTRSSTVRATVKVRLPGGETKTVTSVDCATKITVQQTPTPPPVKPKGNGFCSEFKTPELIDEDQRLYRFTVVANTTNATFDRADFVFSDAPNATMPALPNGGNQATITHAFPATGSYTVEATLHFTDPNGKTVSGGCSTEVTITEAAAAPTCESENKGDCEELTAAGTGTIVAGVFSGASTLAAAGHWIIRRRFFGL